MFDNNIFHYFYKNYDYILDYTRRARVAPKGTFCVENTLNIYHTYDDVTIQNPSIIDLAWKLKIFLYQIVTKRDKNWQIWSNRDKSGQIWSKIDTRTHICFWRHVCKDREHKKPLRGNYITIAVLSIYLIYRRRLRTEEKSTQTEIEICLLADDLSEMSLESDSMSDLFKVDLDPDYIKLDYTRRARVAPKGTFCVENTLNIYHTYDDVTIQNPSIIDLAWKLKIFLYQDVTDLIIFDNIWSDHFWSFLIKNRHI